MILNKLSVREKKIFYVVVGMFLFLVAYHGVWRPIMVKLLQLDDEAFAMQMKFRKAKVFLAQRQEIQEEAKKNPGLEKLDAGSDEEEIAKLLNFIEQTARKTQVSLSDVKPQPVKSDKQSKSYHVELNAEAGLEQLIDFIYEIEHSPQLLRLEQVNTALKEEKATALKAFLVVSRVVVK